MPTGHSAARGTYSSYTISVPAQSEMTVSMIARTFFQDSPP